MLGRRLHNQRLVRSPLRTPAEVVAWVGAVQAQDYGGARWGLGQRAKDVSDAIVEQAFDDGHILRTHVPATHLAFRQPQGHPVDVDLVVEVAPFARLGRDETRALGAAVDRYGQFIDKVASVKILHPKR